MSRWDEATCIDHENTVARYDESLNELERPSATSPWIENTEAAVAFRQLARLRHLVYRDTMRSLPLKADLFDFVDEFAVACPQMTDSAVQLNSHLMDFNELPWVASELDSNPFFSEASRGRRRFRTSLGTYPVSNVKFGVHDGVIGELLNKMFSITPLDYALAGMVDHADKDDSDDEGAIVIPTEFLDPELDLIYDINGYAWEFDAELHCVRSEYNHWREIRERMVARNGRVNKAHLILFAAMRLASVLEAIRPLSVEHQSRMEYNIRGYLLAVLNGGGDLIRLFKQFVSLIDLGGNTMAFDAIAGLGIAVECREDEHRISVSTEYVSLSHLIIKGVLEGAKRLDTSREVDPFIPFSEYGNNELLIKLFLNTVHSLGSGGASKDERAIKCLKSLLALSLNTRYGRFREALVSRNNGINQGIALEKESFEWLYRIVQGLQGAEEDRERENVKKIVDMEALGACGASDETMWTVEAQGSSKRRLYALRPPSSCSIALQRRGRGVGELSVVGNKFEFCKFQDASVGVLPIFQGLEGVNAEDFEQIMRFGASVEFESVANGTSIANACLSNVFGFKGAVFVLEHILYGDVAVSRDTAPGYLKQANGSGEGVEIRSLLHPVVTEQVGFYKEVDRDVFSFDMRTGFELDHVVTSRKVAYCKMVERKVRDWEGEAMCMERKFLA